MYFQQAHNSNGIHKFDPTNPNATSTQQIQEIMEHIIPSSGEYNLSILQRILIKLYPTLRMNVAS